jgi:signal transduction histidine kinase
MEQVVSNLISNAIKYGEGRPIKVELHRDDDVVTLRVLDHGLGIASEDLDRIFEPFERAASAHRSQSLGLGLYIVRQIVESHAGTIRVESELGQGASFVVTLPLRAANAPISAHPSA